MSVNQDRIRCSVRNCHYWSDGNHCLASSIMVTSDSIPRETYHGIDSSEISALDTPVDQCEQTCCKTFISGEETDEHRIDDVYKLEARGTQRTQSARQTQQLQ